MIKRIIKILLILLMGLIIGFGGAWFYFNYFRSNNSVNIKNNEQYFSARSDISTITYPFRNWAIKEEPQIAAQGVLLMDIDNDYIFYQREANVRRPIASITKLMTAVIAGENINNQELIPITQKALNTDGDPAIFYLNEKVTINDLIKSLLMISSNKAAISISDFYGENNFVALMNQKAKELSMTQTTFVEPTGLNFLNQSSPNDLKKLIKYIIANHPNFLLISKNFEDKIYGRNPNVIHDLKNINQLTQKPNYLDDLGIIFLGGKTGFTDEAWQTFAGVFLVPSQRSDGMARRILVVVLKTPNRYNDIEVLLRWLIKAYIF
ncbi:MAG: serine hydrolase [Patescibacteria group bacterium]|nr:serine hydrolase [Patescibacteria group bacterium]